MQEFNLDFLGDSNVLDWNIGYIGSSDDSTWDISVTGDSNTWDIDQGYVASAERLDLDLDVFFPSLDLFFKDLEANANLNISLHEVWRNSYSKGYFQELHDHLPLHLSGVVFLTDWKEGDAKFYFHHRHQSEISKEWRDLCLGRNNYFVEGK